MRISLRKKGVKQMEEAEYKLPLGLLRQAVMKLESFQTDMREASEEEGIDADDKENFDKMAEMSGLMMAHIINIVGKEMGEEEFLSEELEMDNIDPFPGTDTDIGTEPAE